MSWLSIVFGWYRHVTRVESYSLNRGRGDERLKNRHFQIVGGRIVPERQTAGQTADLGNVATGRRLLPWAEFVQGDDAARAEESRIVRREREKARARMQAAVAAHWTEENTPLGARPVKKVAAAKDPAQRSLMLSLLKQDGVDGTRTKTELGRLWSEQAASRGNEKTGTRVVEALVRDGALEVDEGSGRIWLVAGWAERSAETAPQKVCVVDGCGGARAVGGGARCEACQTELNRHAARDPRRMAYKDPAYLAVRWPAGTRCVLRYEGICTGEATTRDHRIPLNDGGTNDRENLRPACRECNSSRRDGRR